MRLICPNCGAQYEVPDDVIPEGGRDVQCSNCGHTWFESPGASAAAEDDIVTETVREDVSPEPEPEPQPADTPEASAAPDIVQSEPVVPADTDDGDDEMPELAPAPQRDVPAQRPQLDASIAEILKEEAEREEEQRRQEAQSGLESQGDLGIDEVTAPPAIPMPDVPEDAREAEAQQRMARLKGEDVDPVQSAVAATVAGSRKELLPDIEEINSTLRSDEERDPVAPLEEEVVAEEKRGFRRGFLTVLIVFIILALIYIFADLIAAQVPAIAGPLEAYVSGVDSLRIWLDVQIQNLLAMMESTPDADAASDG